MTDERVLEGRGNLLERASQLLRCEHLRKQSQVIFLTAGKGKPLKEIAQILVRFQAAGFGCLNQAVEKDSRISRL
jgi:hypothetical protein